jgi:hypothetical protein
MVFGWVVQFQLKVVVAFFDAAATRSDSAGQTLIEGKNKYIMPEDTLHQFFDLGIYRAIRL